MRAVGYSLEAAVADIVDNSISADSHHIALRFSPYGEPHIAVIDDGRGMDSRELVDAMRHGSRNPGDVRSANDLGRFGLGMKTASLSQARQLTVITLQHGVLSAAEWNLAVIERTGQWTLLSYEQAEIEALPYVDDLRRQGKGTVVLWRNLDRLAEGEGSVEAGLREGMTRVREHLSLVFHRFLSGNDRSGRVEISMNLDPVKAMDPFLTWHPATQRLQEQALRISGADVLVQPYVLPHYTKLSPDELLMAGGEEGLRRQQGFYIYRNRRLIVWGTWFRLARQEELTKLARVRVDIPNSLDTLWTLDIKKSSASPPIEVRRSLSTIVGRIGETSGRVYRFRGRRTAGDHLVHMWDRIEGRHGTSYTINREHPLCASLSGLLEDVERNGLEQLLLTIEKMLPVDAIYADMATDRSLIRQRPDYSLEELADLAGRLCDACGDHPDMRRNLIRQLVAMEPFSFYPERTQTLMQRLSNER